MRTKRSVARREQFFIIYGSDAFEFPRTIENKSHIIFPWTEKVENTSFLWNAPFIMAYFIIWAKKRRHPTLILHRRRHGAQKKSAFVSYSSREILISKPHELQWNHWIPLLSNCAFNSQHSSYKIHIRLAFRKIKRKKAHNIRYI